MTASGSSVYLTVNGRNDMILHRNRIRRILQVKLSDNKKRYAGTAGLIAFGAVLFAVLMNFGEVLNALKTLLGCFLPLIAGLVIAFILDVPARKLEKLVIRIFPGTEKKGAGRKIAVILTLVILAGVIAVIAGTVNPVIASSLKSAYEVVLEKIPKLGEAIGLKDLQAAGAGSFFKSFISDGIPEDLPVDVSKALPAVAGKAADTISLVTTLLIGMIISVYVLFDKDRVLRHAGKLITALFPQKTAGQIRRVCGMLTDAYSIFMSGQCIEAVILGGFTYAALTVFRLPYAALNGLLAAVLQFIPFLGSFLSLTIASLLTFITAPEKMILFLVVFLSVQTIEAQLIYPHVVGSSVGLTPLLTLLSVIIGGNTFGLVGVLFIIPMVSVLYTLVREWADRRIRCRTAETPDAADAEQEASALNRESSDGSGNKP